MAIYRCGYLTISFDLEKVEKGRAYYQVMVKLENGDESGVLELGDFSCPVNWTEEEIAKDLVGWTMDLHENMYDEVEYDESKDGDDMYIVVPI